jgi:colanic acid biosynthesis glycosyl transferase WcaI
MRKILYYTYYFYPSAHAASIRAKYFVDSLLLNDDTEVVILTAEKKSPENNKYHIKTILSKTISNKMSNTVRFLFETLHGIRAFFTIIRIPRLEYALVSYPPFFASFIVVLALRLKKTKVITDIRDLYPEVFFSMRVFSESGVMAGVLKMMAAYIHKNSEHILTVTDGLKKLLIENHINAAKISVIRNGFGKDFIPQKNHYETFTVVMHGNLGKFQNIELLIEIAKEIEKYDHSVQFLVIGDGPKRVLFENNNLSNLTYMEPIPYANIPEIIGKAQLGLSLRTDDLISKTAFPVKVFEYIGLKIPVVVAPKGEAGEVIERINGGKQFSSDDLSGIVNYILFLKAYPKNLDKLRCNLETQREQFSRENQALKIKSIIKKLEL